MMFWFRISLATLALVPAAAQAGWEVEKGEKSCSITRDYEDGTRVSFSVDGASDAGGYISLWNDRWISIEEDERFAMTLEFSPRTRRYTFSGEGMTTDESHGIFINLTDNAVLAELMEAGVVHIWNGDSLVGSFKLDGTYAGLLKAAACAGTVSARVKADPFED